MKIVDLDNGEPAFWKKKWREKKGGTLVFWNIYSFSFHGNQSMETTMEFSRKATNIIPLLLFRIFIQLNTSIWYQYIKKTPIQGHELKSVSANHSGITHSGTQPGVNGEYNGIRPRRCLSRRWEWDAWQC